MLPCSAFDIDAGNWTHVLVFEPHNEHFMGGTISLALISLCLKKVFNGLAPPCSSDPIRIIPEILWAG